MIVISDPVSTNTFNSFVHALLFLSDYDKVTGMLNLCPSSFILTLFSEGSESSCWSSGPRFRFMEREDDEGKTLEGLTEKLSTKESSQSISVTCSSTVAPTHTYATTTCRE